MCDPRLFQAAYNRNAPVTAAEVALASALHEVVHLVSSNFEERRPVPKEWPIKGERTDEPVDLLTALDRAGGPIAEAMFFTLEDARQERQGLGVYPGARSVLTDLYRAAFPDANRQAGALSQFSLGCFLVCGGYSEREPLERRFDARAAVALAEASDVLTKAAEAADPWAVATHALELVEIARTEPPPQQDRRGDDRTAEDRRPSRRRLGRRGRGQGSIDEPRGEGRSELLRDPPGGRRQGGTDRARRSI